MSIADAPVLAGIHHLKLPVTDLARSLEWYRSRLGYQVQIEFVEQGTLMGCGLAHPAWRPGPRTAARPGPGPRRRRVRLLRHRRPGQGRHRPARPQAGRARPGPRRRAPRQHGLDPARGARPGRAHAALLHHRAPHRHDARQGHHDPRPSGDRRTPRARGSQSRVVRAGLHGRLWTAAWVSTITRACRQRTGTMSKARARILFRRHHDHEGFSTASSTRSFAIIEIPSESPERHHKRVVRDRRPPCPAG